MTTGIDAIAFDIAKLHLRITTLAKARNIDPDKLEKGLGLLKMTLTSIRQDTVVCAANALTRLIQRLRLAPKKMSRTHVGTYSGIDGARPIGAFVVSLMEQLRGQGRFSHCDAVDLTF